MPSLRRSGGTNGRYLRHFEELGQFGHPVEERLVDLQSFFALVLLHVKVFLCESEDQNQHENKQKIREEWSNFILKSSQVIDHLMNRSLKSLRVGSLSPFFTDLIINERKEGDIYSL